MQRRNAPANSIRTIAPAVVLVAIFAAPAGATLGIASMPVADVLAADAPAIGPGLAAPAWSVSSILDAPALPMGWLDHADDRPALEAALVANLDKVPVEFNARLRYALPDGTLRVMGHLAQRTPASEALVAGNSVKLAWYSETGNFLATVRPDQLTTLLNDPLVQFIEPDFPLSYFLTQSTLDIHARSKTGTGTGVWYWDGTTGTFKSDVSGLTTAITGSGVTAAIIDSGVDRTHKDFSGTSCTPSDPMAACDSRVLLNVKAEATSGQFVQLYPSDALPSTDLASGHGTHVSGIVAGNGWYSRNGILVGVTGGDGNNFGVAPEAKLVVVTNGDTLWAGMANSALDWVRVNHATYGIKVTSNSWGCQGGCAYDPSSVTSDLVHQLYDLGIVNVFAAGNDGGTGSGAEFSGYAQSPYVIGVAAYDRTGHLASFSSRGKSSSSNTLPAFATWTPGSVTSELRPDVAAPGVDIQSARNLSGGAASQVPRVYSKDLSTGLGPNGLNPYVAMSGTSMATPHVTGAVTLLFDECPTASALDVMRAIFAGAHASSLKKTGSSTTAEPFEVGYGQLDIRASLDWLMANVTGC